jgi:hypothetical protein
MNSKRKSKKPLFFLLFIPIFIAGAVFFLRPPVLLVTDLIYDRLYGTFRGGKIQVETSLRLFRRVKTVRIAEDAGTDVAVFTVNSASEKPYCVLFPYRYYREAEQYVREYPGIPAALLLGRIRNFSVSDSALAAIRTDTEEDYFRMGRAAALFALRGNAEEAAEPSKVLLLRDDLVSSEDTEAFYRGLAAEGYAPAPIEVWSGIEYTVPGDVACAVLTGSADFFLNQNLAIPVILFSWLDPALTADTVKVVLDDSPWAQIIPAIAAATAAATGEGENRGIPSETLILGKRIPERDFFRKLTEIFRDIPVDL